MFYISKKKKEKKKLTYPQAVQASFESVAFSSLLRKRACPDSRTLKNPTRLLFLLASFTLIARGCWLQAVKSNIPSRHLSVGKLTIKTLAQCVKYVSGVFIVNFEQISIPCSSVSIVIAGWVYDHPIVAFFASLLFTNLGTTHILALPF